MKVIKEISTFNELWVNSWSGAKDTLTDIMDNDKEDDLMVLLEEIFYEETPTETQLNDFLWFERDYIYETLEMNNEE